MSMATVVTPRLKPQQTILDPWSSYGDGQVNDCYMYGSWLFHYFFKLIWHSKVLFSNLRLKFVAALRRNYF